MTLTLVKDIAQRMIDHEKIKENLCFSYLSESSFSWNPLSLSDGFPALVLLFGTLDQLFPDEKWDIATHLYVIKIKEVIENSGISDLSLFEGLSGCCFALFQASKKQTHYKKMLDRLSDYVFQNLDSLYLKKIKEKIYLKLPAHPSHYELMTGISGIGVYALANLNCPKCAQVLKEILNICIALSKDIQLAGHVMPGWYVPKHYQYTNEDKLYYPKGNFNLGIAHGITGILGFLSIAFLNGVILKGQKEAIEKIISWILLKYKSQDGKIFWSNRISYNEEVFGAKDELSQHSLEAWCYGTTGISRILYLAGKALKNKNLQQTSLNAFEDIFRRINIDQFFYTPTFCHGLAGILMITKLMARDTQSQFLENQVHQLEHTLLKFYNSECFFGFEEKISPWKNQLLNVNSIAGPDKQDQKKEIKNIGLLEGVSGILLALISNCTDDHSWSVPFIIEGN